MRNDHTSYPLGGRHPTPEEIERFISAAHRMRSEAIHAHLKRSANWLKRAVNWLRWPFHADRIKVTVPTRMATC